MGFKRPEVQIFSLRPKFLSRRFDAYGIFLLSCIKSKSNCNCSCIKTANFIVIASISREQTCLQWFANDDIHKTISVFIKTLKTARFL